MDSIPIELVSIIAQNLLPWDLTRFLAAARWIRMGVDKELTLRTQWLPKIHRVHTSLAALNYHCRYSHGRNVSMRLHGKKIVMYEESTRKCRLLYGSINLSDNGISRFICSQNWINTTRAKRGFSHMIVDGHDYMLIYDTLRNTDYFRITHLPRYIIRRITNYLTKRDLMSFIMINVNTCAEYHYSCTHSHQLHYISTVQHMRFRMEPGDIHW